MSVKRFSALIIAISFAMSSLSHATFVKLSRSGICHDESSPSYNQTKNFEAFPSIPECLRAGGRLPKSRLEEASKTSKANGYSREKFGSGWADADKDCQDSRQEALIEQSSSPVTFKDGRDCKVLTGRWISPYSNRVILNASEIDIDHVVPLKWAWEHGADKWTQERREQFANDPVNLLSVEASLNRQKGAKGPTDWLPPEGLCGYVARFKRLVVRYRLEMGLVEDRKVSQILDQCR